MAKSDKRNSASMSVGRDGKTTMSATDGEGNTVEMTGDGKSGRTQISDGGNIVQTDGNQVIVEGN